MKVVEKPWGYEIWWAHAKGKYLGKTLEIKDGKRLSLQYHEQKDETIYVQNGRLTVFWSDIRDGKLTETILEEGESFRVRPGMIHRFSAEHGDVSIVEVSTDFPEDVVRLEDDYDRVED